MDTFAGNATFCSPHIQISDNVLLDPGFWMASAAGFALFVFGSPLNTWVLWLIWKDTEGHVSSDIFSLNLTAMEMYYCLVAPLYYFAVYFSSLDLVLFGAFSDGVIFAGQPLFQAAICLERYLAVVHPIIFLKYKPVRYRVTCSGTIWLLAVGFGVLCQLFYPQFPIYTLATICVAVLAVDLFSSVAILKVLRQPGPGEGEREEMNLMKRRAFATVLIFLVMTLLSYFPLPIVIILCTEGLISSRNIYIAYGITFYIFMSGSLVQPLFYLTRAGKLPCLQQWWKNPRQP